MKLTKPRKKVGAYWKPVWFRMLKNAARRNSATHVRRGVLQGRIAVLGQRTADRALQVLTRALD
jgi:hypothetical protein